VEVVISAKLPEISCPLCHLLPLGALAWRRLVAKVGTSNQDRTSWSFSLYVVLSLYVYVFLPWLRFFRAFSSVVRQMPGYTSQRRGTVRTLPGCCVALCIFCVVLFNVCFVSFSVLFVCICVLYYCHRVATQLQLNISYHIISLSKVRFLNTASGIVNVSKWPSGAQVLSQPVHRTVTYWQWRYQMLY